MTQNDYYEILNVTPDATAKEIKDTYRKLALRFHPDRNPGDADAAEKMKVVNEAYAVLSDPGKRREYDDMRLRFGSSAYNRFRQTYSEQDIFTGSDIHGIFEELARSFGVRGFDEIFKEFYGQGFQTFEIRGDGINGRRFVFSGTFGNNGGATPNIPAGGTFGKATRYLFRKLTGVELPVNGSDVEDVITMDPEAARRGGPYEYLVKGKNKQLKISIPPGIKDGQKIRISGMGEAGVGGAQPGDLFLTVKIKLPLLRKVKDFISGLTASR